MENCICLHALFAEGQKYFGPRKVNTHSFGRYLPKLRYVFKFTELKLYEESFTLRAIVF